MMSRDKDSVDAAVAGFISMLEDDKENIPALLGMSTAFTLEDSSNKVRVAQVGIDTAAVFLYTYETAAEEVFRR